MIVEIRVFAILRELAGAAAIELELEDGSTVADAMRLLECSGPLAGTLARVPVRMAVNREIAAASTPLSPGDELALIPPVSGGAPVRHVRVTAEPLDVQSLSELVADDGAGAIVIFQGVTREVVRLDYEAYQSMAEEQIEQIVDGCAETHGLSAAAAEHRVGPVPLGQASVIVAVSAPHREAAFAGAREIIDRIKVEAPIWKREVYADGTSSWAAPGVAPADTGRFPSATDPHDG